MTKIMAMIAMSLVTLIVVAKLELLENTGLWPFGSGPDEGKG